MIIPVLMVGTSRSPALVADEHRMGGARHQPAGFPLPALEPLATEGPSNIAREILAEVAGQPYPPDGGCGF